MKKTKNPGSPSPKLAVRDRRRPGWLWVDNELIDRFGQELGPIGIAVYVALCRYAGNTTQQCWPTHKTLAKNTGASVSSVKRAIKKLAALHLLHVEPRFTEQGDPTSNLYTLLSVSPSQSAQSPGRSTRDRGSVPREPTMVPREPRTRPNELDSSEPEASEGLAPTPVTFQGWLNLIRERTGRRRTTTLRWMFRTLFPSHEPPEYSYVAKVSKEVGGPERLAQLLWEYSSRPPVGDVLAYLQRVARGASNGQWAERAFLSPEHEAVRKQLQEHFCQQTGLTMPKGASDSEWWGPLETIGQLAEWDVSKGRDLIDRTLDVMEDLTVVAPRSIVNVANAMVADGARLTIEQRRQIAALERRAAQSNARYGVRRPSRQPGHQS